MKSLYGELVTSSSS